MEAKAVSSDGQDPRKRQHPHNQTDKCALDRWNIAKAGTSNPSHGSIRVTTPSHEIDQYVRSTESPSERLLLVLANGTELSRARRASAGAPPGWRGQPSYRMNVQLARS